MRASEGCQQPRRFLLLAAHESQWRICAYILHTPHAARLICWWPFALRSVELSGAVLRYCCCVEICCALICVAAVLLLCCFVAVLLVHAVIVMLRVAVCAV